MDGELLQTHRCQNSSVECPARLSHEVCSLSTTAAGSRGAWNHAAQVRSLTDVSKQRYSKLLRGIPSLMILYFCRTPHMEMTGTPSWRLQSQNAMRLPFVSSDQPVVPKTWWPPPIGKHSIANSLEVEVNYQCKIEGLHRFMVRRVHERKDYLEMLSM